MNFGDDGAEANTITHRYHPFPTDVIELADKPEELVTAPVDKLKYPYFVPVSSCKPINGLPETVFAKTEKVQMNAEERF